MRIWKELEFRRQLMHLLVGVIIVILVYFSIINTVILFLIFLFGSFISLMSKKYKIPFVSSMLKYFERPHHMKSLPGKGLLFMMLGAFLSLVLFQRDVALASITILALGDSISPIVGRYLGRTKHPLSNAKLLEGSIAGIFVAFTGASFFVSYLEAFLASLVSMTFEAIEFKIGKHIVDDNLTIPLLSGVVISIMRIMIS